MRGLSKQNAERVARHLVMAGTLLDSDPEFAYRHAKAAVETAGRVDVVREAAGIAAYRAGHFEEALRELRTARRMTGSWTYAALEADCERGLGRPGRAIQFAKEALDQRLPAEIQVEIVIVLAGARDDEGDQPAALAEIGRALASLPASAPAQLRARLEAARALIAGEDIPGELLEMADPVETVYEDVDVIDAFDEEADAGTEDAPGEDALGEDAPGADAPGDRAPGGGDAGTEGYSASREERAEAGESREDAR